jgi:hypothetical protein
MFPLQQTIRDAMQLEESKRLTMLNHVLTLPLVTLCINI